MWIPAKEYVDLASFISSVVTIFGLPLAIFTFLDSGHSRWREEWIERFQAIGEGSNNFDASATLLRRAYLSKRTFWRLNRLSRYHAIEAAIEGLEKSGAYDFTNAVGRAGFLWAAAQLQLMEMEPGGLIIGGVNGTRYAWSWPRRMAAKLGLIDRS